ncbi:MAG: creatininase family protein [bacterium]
MPREVRWERMYRDELESAIEACPVVYFAYGLCEPHGPQNTLGLDTLKAHGVCCAAARAHGGIVAPPDYWHIHEMGPYGSFCARAIGETRAWLTDVPAWVHFRNICYHVRAADALGFQAAILLTGHYGPNWEDLKTLVDLLQPHLAMRLYGLPDFEANQPGFDRDGERDGRGDHAGRVETSLLWALEPDCVDMSRLPEKETEAPGPHFAMGHNAHESDRRVGERMVEDEVRWLGKKAEQLLEDYRRLQPERQPLSFMDIERIWEEHIRPALKSFKTMQYLDRTPPPDDSRWQLNYQLPDRVPGA